ncbi:MAG: glycerol-3-phosphate dehydrogenase/oxidase [Gammaproteobacteria bacterium]|nr:glycerol-3-phosphate dehydrogenase/oxidase [Gammaproteobacteria bacterium]
MDREANQLAQQQFDVLIWGGGIYGAWTAYDAALRGLSVAIVDKGDWGSGTSCASSKLIHGGLRYLETLDFSLVKKALAEREMLLDVAPHRVWSLRFGVPVYKNSRVSRLKLKAGLMLYDLLGSNKTSSQGHSVFDGHSFAERFPGINEQGLLAGYTYADAQTDDARLVLELIDGAIAAGAVALNYCSVENIIEHNSQVSGLTVCDLVSDRYINVSAKHVVNTAGRWMSELEEVRPWCRLSKGIHLVLPPLLQNEALLVTAQSDGRVFFIIPWYGFTLIGTTDSNYNADLDNLAIEQHEIDYLLDEVNAVFPDFHWSHDDILGTFSGLRVLQHSNADSPSAISRDWELKTLDNGILVSVGGKLTSAREDASVIVDRIAQQLEVDKPCQTTNKAFPWKPGGDYQDWFENHCSQAIDLGVDMQSAEWMLKRHGNRANELFNLIKQHPELADRVVGTLPFTLADLVFCCENEMVVHLDDLLRRRIPVFILAKISQLQLQKLAETTGKLLKWDQARIGHEVERCIQTYELKIA